MTKVWMKAVGSCPIEEQGKIRIHEPGNSFECGRHQARQLEAQGLAIISPWNPQRRNLVLDLGDCGILALDGCEQARKEAERLATQYLIDVTGGPLGLPFPRTLILGDCKPVSRFVPVGFRWLDEGWQVAVPMVDMETLAGDVGDPKSRSETEFVIHDLRVPVYDTRLVFVLRCAEMVAMVEQWADEREQGSDELAFLRSLYQATPVWTPLPPSWIHG
jgi:hypothetical protein